MVEALEDWLGWGSLRSPFNLLSVGVICPTPGPLAPVARSKPGGCWDLGKDALQQPLDLSLGGLTLIGPGSLGGPHLGTLGTDKPKLGGGLDELSPSPGPVGTGEQILVVCL